MTFSFVADRLRSRLPRAFALVVLTVFACSVPLGASTARAGQPAPAADPNAPVVHNTWAITPTGTDPSQPSTRPNLTYALAPGATVTDSVTVWNYSDVPLQFKIYATDAFNNAGGKFDLLTGKETPKDIGSWVSTAVNAATVNARSKVDVPITLTVPTNASPGDHAGGLVASSEGGGTDDKGNQVVIDRRVATRVYLRVAGPLNPSLVIDAVASTYNRSNPLGAGDLDVTYTVRNAGNVRLAAQQRLDVAGLFGLGSQTQNPPDLPELLPGSSLTQTAHFSSVLPLVRLSADVTETPVSSQGGLDPEPAPSTRSASVWAIPWALLLLVTLVVIAWRVDARRRRRRRQRAGSDGDGVSDRSSPPSGDGSPVPALAGRGPSPDRDGDE